MSKQLYTLIGLTVLLAFVVLFFVVPALAPTVGAVTAQGPYDLGSITQLLGMSDTSAFFTSPSATFQAFVYPSAGMRTTVHSTCGTARGQPSCTDGSFPLCNCDFASSCAPCAHPGYLPIFSLGGNVKLELLPAPDAGRQGAASMLLTIVTETVASQASIDAYNSRAGVTNPIPATGNPIMQKSVETVSLPNIPLQKWTFITISREGRRFDVYYNDSVVASYMTTNMVKMDVENGLGTTSGADGLLGKVALARVFKSRQSGLDISTAYATLADTRGTPFVALKEMKGGAGATDATGLFPQAPSASTLLDAVSKFSICPGGNCTAAPAVRPANPLYDWESPYQ